MNKSILFWALAVLSVLSVSSCKEDNEVVLTTDCYISNFTLGSVKRLVHSKTISGNDTTYYVSYAAGYYPMVIDQLAGTIENNDSLLVNSVVKAVLVNIESTGTVVYRKAEQENNWKNYSMSDSIDFTTPLVFRVYTKDNSAWRDYAVKLNVHQLDGDVLQWQKMTDLNVGSSVQAMKMFVWNDRVWTYIQSGDGMKVFATEDAAGNLWKEEVMTGCGGADINTLAISANGLYMSDTSGHLLVSNDALNWSVVDTEQKVKLFAADQTTIYAFSEQGVCASVDGKEWMFEGLDSDVKYLPTQDITAVAYKQDKRVNRVLMLGNRDESEYPEDKNAMVWSRSGVSSWTYFNISSENHYACPRLESPVLLHYGDVLLLLGRENSEADASAPEYKIYVSKDNGISWRNDEVYMLPNIINDSQLTATVDKNDYIWLIVGAEVWKARLNKYGFES